MTTREALQRTLDLMSNILTDSQLDTRTECGCTVRDWYAQTEAVLRQRDYLLVTDALPASNGMLERRVVLARDERPCFITWMESRHGPDQPWHQFWGHYFEGDLAAAAVDFKEREGKLR